MSVKPRVRARLEREAIAAEEKRIAEMTPAERHADRVRTQYLKLRRELDVQLYLANPRAFGTVDDSVNEALDRKRRERAA